MQLAVQRRSQPAFATSETWLVWFLAALEKSQRVFPFTGPADEVFGVLRVKVLSCTVGKDKSPEVAVDVGGSHGLCEVTGELLHAH